jgi:predicted nucleotidyltransferase
MNEIIQAQLIKIEKENNVKILYAVESGSRGWGFESKDSDFDVRFIYIHPVEWYLNVFEGSDINEIPVDKVLDVNGWDLRKAMRLMYKSNPPLLEWLSSPIIYKQDISFIKGLKSVAEKYFVPVHATYHYINLAKKSFDGLLNTENIKLKKLFYVIRPVLSCMWIESYNTIPQMNLQEMMSKVEIDNQIRKMIDELVIIKADSIETDTIRQPIEIINYLKQKLDYYDNYIIGVKNEKNRDSSDLNSFFQKTLKDYYGGI